MTDEYSLWRVIISYNFEGDIDEVFDLPELYMVIAQNAGEAKTKSLTYFRETPQYASATMIKTDVKKISKRRLTIPQLTIEEDRQHFSVSVRLSADNSCLEYVVHQLKGR